MKYLKTYPEKCTGCGTCMRICSTTFFKEDNPRRSAIRVEPDGENRWKITVCNQKCRLCVSECPVVAITVSKLGVPLISRKICVGCLACVAVCPIGAMMTDDGLENPFKCVACGACARQCPEHALEIVTEEE